MAGIDDVLESFSFTISAQERCSRDSVILLISGRTSVRFSQRRQNCVVLVRIEVYSKWVELCYFGKGRIGGGGVRAGGGGHGLGLNSFVFCHYHNPDWQFLE